MKTLLVILCLSFGLVGCSENQRAKSFGGSMTLMLPTNAKLVTVTWKEGGSLWYLIRPMRYEEIAETYTFLEDSAYGIVQGTVKIVETRK